MILLEYFTMSKNYERLCRLTDKDWLSNQRDILPIIRYNYEANQYIIGDRCETIS